MKRTVTPDSTAALTHGIIDRQYSPAVIDYGQAYRELEPISQEPEAIALLEATKL